MTGVDTPTRIPEPAFGPIEPPLWTLCLFGGGSIPVNCNYIIIIMKDFGLAVCLPIKLSIMDVFVAVYWQFHLGKPSQVRWCY